ncbi:MAG: hypothetical protein COS71_01280 [Candidatus Moranbacteria bacterium CG06_land_8_20_14_3_00_40_12]|nr:MAG: hypothetical protein COX31_01725 [Candidatus Moranbacteria bacterium CG23_combo_of_CG06-09_8_20_14_all_40_16]PIU80835.1 MAG: hypothetical protein COS71_01280 [Candidatus Moranbacteria bacterium CG06_land_8_20_14_3_00_40_12]
MKNFWQKLKKPILALAPMAGITDSAFRLICRRYGTDVVYSEMASASALYYKPKKTLELLKFNRKERPYVVQLFGKNPEHFAKAARILDSLPLEKGELERDFHPKLKQKSPLIPLFQRGKIYRPDGLDINFGCPAKKVFNHGSGCALMLDIKLTREIIEAVLRNTSLPVSIKIRAGVKKQTALNFIKKLKDLPFQAIMLHGRTYEGGFGGPVDFALAQKIKQSVPEKIVLLNGGITDPKQAREILDQYPLIDGLGIGRGVLGRPWLFEEIKNLLQNPSLLIKERCREATERYNFEKNHPVKSPRSEVVRPLADEFNRVKKVIMEHAKLIYKNKPRTGALEIRKHLAWYVRGFPGASEMRKKLVRTESLEEIKRILK